MKIKSVSGHIVVKLNPGAQVTPGGIALPETTSLLGDPAKKATVVYRRDGSQFYVGEVVLIDQYMGLLVKEGNEEFLIVKETDVFGTVEE